VAIPRELLWDEVKFPPTGLIGWRPLHNFRQMVERWVSFVSTVLCALPILAGSSGTSPAGTNKTYPADRSNSPLPGIIGRWDRLDALL
jgi:hypothetical protein